MRDAFGALGAGLPTHAGARGGAEGGGWIAATPLDAQPEPENLIALTAAVAAAWPMAGLLAIPKEADPRLGVTDALRRAARRSGARARPRARPTPSTSARGTRTSRRSGTSGTAGAA